MSLIQVNILGFHRTALMKLNDLNTIVSKQLLCQKKHPYTDLIAIFHYILQNSLKMKALFRHP